MAAQQSHAAAGTTPDPAPALASEEVSKIMQQNCCFVYLPCLLATLIHCKVLEMVFTGEKQRGIWTKVIEKACHRDRLVLGYEIFV